jgi:hypothetical protein
VYLCKVVSDILTAMDCGEVTILVFLVLSAAFDAIDHVHDVVLENILEMTLVSITKCFGGQGLILETGSNMLSFQEFFDHSLHILNSGYSKEAVMARLFFYPTPASCSVFQQSPP